MDKMSKRKLNSLTLRDKLDIINLIESGKRQIDISKEKSIPKSTISVIWKKRASLKESFDNVSDTLKKLKKPVYQDIDSALLKWFKTSRHDNANIPLNGNLLVKKAKEFAKRFGHDDFKGSDGWLSKWKKRHGIAFRSAAGETDHSLDDWIKTRWPAISAGYSEDDIFICDETGLFYKLLPYKSCQFQGERCEGGSNSKLRNATEKIRPLVIGKSRPFDSLPVEDFGHKKSWMTREIFESWLRRLDLKMIKKKRKILLILDSCSAHSSNVKLENIKLVCLPPNCAYKAQPCDQGITNEIKKKYRTVIVQKVLQELEKKVDPDINILEAIFAVSASWNQLQPNAIQNSFCRETAEDDEEVLQDQDDDAFIFSELAQKLKSEKANLPNFADYVSCDYKVDDEMEAKSPEASEETESEDVQSEKRRSETMSCSEFLDCINRMKHFVASQDSPDDTLFHNLNNLEQFGFNILYMKTK